MKHPKVQLVKPTVTEKGAVMISTDKLVPQRVIGQLLRGPSIAMRAHGCLRGNAIFLDDDEYDWTLVRDEEDCLCLVPLRKEEEDAESF